MSVKIVVGDALEQLRLLPEESVHCCVTSPPYYGLRDYGMAGQIGLEASPDAYVAALAAVMREVRRVLRRDGTLWLNVGDCYNSQNGFHRGEKYMDGGMPRVREYPSRKESGVKVKDLIGIPWMLAFALRADGWYLRQDIIWAKPNPMPESVTDRCTKAHEYLFLLSRSERYRYDADAIAEGANSLGRQCTSKILSPKTLALQENGTHNRGGDLGINYERETRNKRSVWTVASEPFPESHFATFPPALIEPCILAGCPRECCAKCGAPWVRDVDRSGVPRERNLIVNTTKSLAGINEAHRLDGKNYIPARISTDRWSPSCTCAAATVPGTVLDPFAGAGTTGLVADRLGRNAVLIELNPLYAGMAERRIWRDGPLFADVAIIAAD